MMETHTLRSRYMEEEDTEQVNVMIIGLNQPQSILAYINCVDLPIAQVQDPPYFLTGGDKPTNPSSDNPSVDSSLASRSSRSP